MLDVNVFVTRRIPQPGLDILFENCRDVEVNPDDRVLTREELLAQVEGRDGILSLLTDSIDADVMDAAEGCKVVANYAVGFNNVDVPAATARGIVITNTPGVLTDATADMAWALLFCTARRVVEADKFTREGKFKGWGPMLFLGGDITGKTLGIVGAGRIGSAMAKKSVGFRMEVLYADPVRNEDMEHEIGATRVPLDTLLRESDFVSVHTLLSEATTRMIGERELGLMKPTAYLINTSRGPVIDENALVKALQEKQIAGAGLDVFEDEPQLAPGLVELDNVVVPPHIASATIGTRAKMATMAATNLVAVLKGETPPNCVNPEVLGK